MEYECKQVNEYLVRLQEVAIAFLEPTDLAKWRKPSKQDWRLEEPENDDDELTDDMMMIIMKARRVLHEMRWDAIHRRRRRIDIDIVIEKVKVEVRFCKTFKDIQT